MNTLMRTSFFAEAKALWTGLVKRYGGRLEPDFDLSTLAHLSDGYASGAIDQARPAPAARHA